VGLFQDVVARGTGDIVTVLVVESAAATGQVTTETKREESMEGGPGTDAFDFISGWGISGKSDQKGQGTAGRKANLVAKIPARVVEVLPDGTLRLEGSREVEVNGEREILSLTGLVRPMDIGPENTVLSSVIADARIQYHGRGPITNGQRISRFMRLVNWIF
jgi:flagellar L-ring protein precursor FlgH